jgi:D-glycero-alpha-D-manno-heptose-7-phosphate kinase
MIISRTPFRVSLFGGGTDYPRWYRREGGAVLSATIDKYCYLSCRLLPRFFEARHRIVWSHIEVVSTIAEILHPCVREGLRYLCWDTANGVEIHHQGDLPARAGMGSSSAFAVGLINALCALRGERLDPPELARRAMELEQDVLRENVGSQDQVASAYGGFNRIDFAPDGGIAVKPLALPPERLAALESRLLLLFSGTTRLASDVAGSILESLDDRAQELRAMRAMVDDAHRMLAGGGDLDGIGKLLHEGWQLKRSLSPRVSNPTIDGIYEAALRSGALGGKLLGAGGSGFLLLYAPPERHAAIRAALPHLLHVPFKVEPRGSRIIYDGRDA